MKKFHLINLPLITAVFTFAAGVLFLSACPPFFGSDQTNSGQDSKGWKVWLKRSPCSGGRTDWISVAQRNLTEGGGGNWTLVSVTAIPETPARCIANFYDRFFRTLKL